MAFEWSLADNSCAAKEASMTAERAPKHEQPLLGEGDTTSWQVARERLTNDDPQRTNWLATIRPDGRPHVMPVIGGWFDDAFHFIAGEHTRKGRNLAADGRCVIATGSRTLPSLDIVVEGRAEPMTDGNEVRRIAAAFGAVGWPSLEVRGVEVYGPNAPTAGPPPFRIYRMIPSKAFGLPGTFGMEQFDQSELPKPTRWVFDSE
jgi:Pyridoxamine 5'-phosphate oxidase